MRKKGKSFKRYLDPLSGLRAISMQHGLDESQLTDLSVALHVALEALRTGKADEQAFHNTAAAINVAKVLAERGFGEEEHALAIADAMEGLLRLWTRGKKTGRWVLDGPGYSALTKGADVFESQMAVVSRKEAKDALEEVRRRVYRGEVLEEQRGAA